MREGRHLGDLLSALLDGELDEPTADAARAHLGRCRHCQHELAVISQARVAIRDLPMLDPPFGLFERLLLHRRPGWWQRGVAAVAAGGVAAVLVANLMTPKPDPVTPPVSDLVRTHAASASVAGDPVSNLVPAGVPVSFRP